MAKHSLALLVGGLRRCRQQLGNLACATRGPRASPRQHRVWTWVGGRCPWVTAWLHCQTCHCGQYNLPVWLPWGFLQPKQGPHKCPLCQGSALLEGGPRERRLQGPDPHNQREGQLIPSQTARSKTRQAPD